MAEYELVLPKMGESVAEATIIKWVKQPGDTIREDDEVVEIATDKVDSDVPSPVNGILKKQVRKENDVVQVGEVIAIIETEDETDKPATSAFTESTASIDKAEPGYPIEEPEHQKEEVPGTDQLSKAVEKSENANKDFNFYSPLIRSIAAEEGISFDELSKIKGTGVENRVTKHDILDYIKHRGSSVALNGKKESPQPVAEKGSPQPIDEEIKKDEQPETKKTEPETPVKPPVVSVSGGDEIIEMDRMRRLISEHMVMSKQTSPHVNSFVEADVTNIVQWREKVKNDFEKREGEKITYTPIFIEAVAKAISDFPMINISVKGTQIIKKKDVNIGMAAALPSGNLIVPVIKKADQLNLVGIVKAVNDLADRARNNRLLPDDVQDGTFTMTNIGSFGNIMGTPIINQPQVAILAFGAIKKKPAVIETNTGDMIGIRHMMFLSLAYDHRVVDGALGGSFVKRVADYLEGWDIDRKI